MSDAYRLLRCERPDTLGKLCAEHAVSVTDTWLPLQLFRTTRGNDGNPVHIPPDVPVVLLNHQTSQLVTRRCDILSQMPLLLVDELKFAIPPSAVPPGCTVFVRATKTMSKKRVPQSITLLHRPITAAKAVEEGSSLVEGEYKRPVKRSHGSIASVTVTPVVVGNAGGDLERCKKKAKSDIVFEHNLLDALVEIRGECATQENLIIKETMENIMRVRDAAPLHFVTHGKVQTMLHVDGTSWNLSDRRVMYRVFRKRDGAMDDGNSSTYTDCARLIAVFMIDDVLLKRESIDTHMQHGKQSYTVIDPDLPVSAQKLAEKGYRVVLLDHYPTLHHGNAFALEAKLNPIIELCKKYFTCNVTVVLSTMSNISASTRRDGMPFILPNSGIWQFFLTQLNGGLRADAESLLVGASSALEDNSCDASSQYRKHVQFALNCDLRYVDGTTLKKETLQP